MSEPIYVVAGAVRIQQWISRTPLLRLSRGASRALAERTASARVAQMLSDDPCGAVVATDAPEVDGVVVVQITDAEEADADGAVGVVVGWLRRNLAEQLPGIEWQVWAHRAGTYVAAYRAAAHEGVLSHGRWHLPSADVDMPLAEACRGCGQEVAVAARTLPDDDGGEMRFGPDCLVRLTYTRGLDREKRAWHFDKLARDGGVNRDARALHQTIGRREADNHLATIAADGNRVGDLFTRLADIPAVRYRFDGQTTTLHQRISQQLHSAAAEAVHAAGGVGDEDPICRPSIDHLIGGDDVLVSVGARFAWAYVEVLLREFEEQFSRNLTFVLQHAEENDAIDPAAAADLQALTAEVSLGVGLAFANRKHPFAHCVEMAQLALTAAKRTGRGNAAVSWIDLTVESAIPAGRFVLADDLETTIPTAFALNPAARATLAGILRDERAKRVGRTGDADDREQVAREIGAEVTAWSRRTRRDDLLPERVTLANLQRLESDLDRARWSPKTNQEAR